MNKKWHIVKHTTRKGKRIQKTTEFNWKPKEVHIISVCVRCTKKKEPKLKYNAFLWVYIALLYCALFYVASIYREFNVVEEYPQIPSSKKSQMISVLFVSFICSGHYLTLSLLWILGVTLLVLLLHHVYICAFAKYTNRKAAFIFLSAFETRNTHGPIYASRWWLHRFFFILQMLYTYEKFQQNWIHAEVAAAISQYTR